MTILTFRGSAAYNTMSCEEVAEYTQ